MQVSMFLNVHNLTPKEFIKLKSVMVNDTEWERSDGKFYMSGDIFIGDFQVSVFTKDYETRLELVALSSKSKNL